MPRNATAVPITGEMTDFSFSRTRPEAELWCNTPLDPLRPRTVTLVVDSPDPISHPGVSTNQQTTGGYA